MLKILLILGAIQIIRDTIGGDFAVFRSKKSLFKAKLGFVINLPFKYFITRLRIVMH